jgi:hypothetical protein
MKKAIAAMLSLCIVGQVTAGSNTVNVTSEGHHLSGSFWAPGVVVTAAHIDAEHKKALCTNKMEDVAFVVTHKEVPQSVIWRDPVEGEPIEYVGKQSVGGLIIGYASDSYTETTMNGVANGTMTVGNWYGNDKVFASGTGRVKKGMSGGSVISKVDGARLGIIVGYGRDTETQEYYTVFTPASIIKQQWLECVNQLADRR